MTMILSKEPSSILYPQILIPSYLVRTSVKDPHPLAVDFSFLTDFVCSPLMVDPFIYSSTVELVSCVSRRRGLQPLSAR